EARELVAAVVRPHRIVEVVLVERARLIQTIATTRGLPLLAAVMLLASVLFALPHRAGLCLPITLRVAAPSVGLVALRFPSLHVFSSYLGCRARLSQNLAMALTVSSVAGIFVTGFAPIVWFVGVTTSPGSIAVPAVSLAFLSAALAAGLGQLGRTVWADAT